MWTHALTAFNCDAFTSVESNDIVQYGSITTPLLPTFWLIDAWLRISGNTKLSSWWALQVSPRWQTPKHSHVAARPGQVEQDRASLVKWSGANPLQLTTKKRTRCQLSCDAMWCYVAEPLCGNLRAAIGWCSRVTDQWQNFSWNLHLLARIPHL